MQIRYNYRDYWRWLLGLHAGKLVNIHNNSLWMLGSHTSSAWERWRGVTACEHLGGWLLESPRWCQRSWTASDLGYMISQGQEIVLEGNVFGRGGSSGVREDFEKIWCGRPCWVTWMTQTLRLVVRTRVNILMIVKFDHYSLDFLISLLLANTQLTGKFLRNLTR